MPEIDFYSNYVINKSNWYKDIISKLDSNKSEIIVERDNQVNSLQEELEKIKSELSDTTHRLDHINNSKAWKICKRFYKVRNKMLGRK